MNPFSSGGRIQYIPGRVKSRTDLPQDLTQSEEDAIRNLALQRDLVAADLLEGDKFLDMLDAAIDDQMKNFNLPAGEIEDAARKLCGSDSIDWECYKKAKELLRIAPWIAHGFDPVQTMFGTGITPSVGTKLMNCSEFNPNTFFPDISSIGSDNDVIPNGQGADPKLPKLPFEEIQKKAQKNQKAWAMLILFWDLLWGKPEVKEPYLSQSKTGSLNVEQISESVQKVKQQAAELRNKGQTELADKLEAQADKVAKSIATLQLPDTIRQERPWMVKHLKWETFPPGDAIDDVLRSKSDGSLDNENFNNKSAAVAINLKSLFESRDKYYNKGIPAIKTGFVLPILITILSLIPKVSAPVFKLRKSFLEKITPFKKIPVVGKKIFNIIKGIVSVPAFVFGCVNNPLIEACIWIAMKPLGYGVDIGELPDSFGDLGIVKSSTSDNITSLNLEDTPAGFVPLDCLSAAQEIVSKVHNYAVSS